MKNAKMNTMAVVTAKDFVNGNPDKNGLEPVILVNLAGKLPNRTVISGTIAEREGFIPGNTYLIKCTEQNESPEYGRQFTFSLVKELGAIEILDAQKHLGDAVTIDVAANAPTSSTESVKEEVRETEFDKA